MGSYRKFSTGTSTESGESSTSENLSNTTSSIYTTDTEITSIGTSTETVETNTSENTEYPDSEITSTNLNQWLAFH